MTTRAEVYAAIDSERDYQEKRWQGHKHSVDEWLLYMQDYVNESTHTVSRSDTTGDVTKILDIVRKVTALGVACMEQLGAPKREALWSNTK